jgi:hypothetical protein
MWRSGVLVKPGKSASYADRPADWQADSANGNIPIRLTNKAVMVATAIDLHPHGSSKEEVCERREKVSFFPDRPVGRSTGIRMDIPLEDRVVRDGGQSMHRRTAEQIRDVKTIFRKGFCPVHRMSPMGCPGSALFRSDRQRLARLLENVVGGNLVKRISVVSEAADNARIAQHRMQQI